MSRLDELIALSQGGDEAATELLVTENSGLIWSVARRFTGRGTETEDLFQLGCLGFLKAVEGFDPDSIDYFAEREHEAWYKLKVNLGWTYGTDGKEKTSPNLVSWDKLDEDIKRNNKRKMY